MFLNVLYIFKEWPILHPIVIQINLNLNTKKKDNSIPPLSVITGEQPTSLNMDTISTG